MRFGDQPARIAEVEDADAVRIGGRQTDDIVVVVCRREDLTSHSNRAGEHTQRRESLRKPVLFRRDNERVINVEPDRGACTGRCLRCPRRRGLP